MRFVMGLVLLGTVAAAPVAAQEEFKPVQAYFGLQGIYAKPSGEFADYVEHGGGVNVNVVWPVTTEGPFALRADGGFIVYGSETKRVCFQSTNCRIELDLTTTNSIAYLNVGPQLMVPAGPIRPYINAAGGFSYFGTTSSVEGSSGEDPFASTSNFDDITFMWSGGGGLLIRLSSGQTPVFLDIGARYNGNGEVEYLKEGDIQDTPTGIEFTPTRSDANLWQFGIGVTIGARQGSGS
jgi:hypothetical protein